MFPRIRAVEPVGGYRLQLIFTSGEQAEIDLSQRILNRGGVFAPLQNIDYFQQVRVDREVGTLVWPNGVDLDPDVLYSEAMHVPLPQWEAASYL